MRKVVLFITLLVLSVPVVAQANNHTLHRCRQHHTRRYCHKHRFHSTRHRRYVTGWEHGTASWYHDQGHTASGWHARYGFADCANYTTHCWPFGTRVKFCYRHRCVVATADDHGPYLSGRDFDLGENTAQAIGFSGVDTVMYRIVSYG